VTNSDFEPELLRAAVDEIDPAEWDAVLEQFDDASVYQSWQYGQASWGDENVSRLVLRDGEGQLVSAVQVRILRVPVLPFGIAYVRYGPMWKLKHKDRDIARFEAGLRALIDEYAVRRGLLVRLRPYGFRELDADMTPVLDSAGFTLTRGTQRYVPRTILLDLEPSVDELRARLKKNWRYYLRKATGAGSEIVESFDGSLFDEFGRLYWEMVETKKFKPGSDLQKFVTLQEKLAPNRKMRVAIARHDGNVVSGSVCSSGFGETCIGLLAATGGAGRAVNAYYLLQWDEIVWAKESGYKLYDLGGINPETNPGVYQFKRGMRGEEVTALGVYDMCRNPIYRAALLLERALSWRPFKETANSSANSGKQAKS